MLNTDYSMFVETSKVHDKNLGPFESYGQIYSAFKTQSEKEVARIKRRFGHSEIRAKDHQARLMTTFGSKTTIGSASTGPSKIAKELIQKYSPRGAHVTGLMGAASEEGHQREALKRLNQNV